MQSFIGLRCTGGKRGCFRRFRIRRQARADRRMRGLLQRGLLQRGLLQRGLLQRGLLTCKLLDVFPRSVVLGLFGQYPGRDPLGLDGLWRWGRGVCSGLGRYDGFCGGDDDLGHCFGHWFRDGLAYGSSRFARNRRRFSDGQWFGQQFGRRRRVEFVPMNGKSTFPILGADQNLIEVAGLVELAQKAFLIALERFGRRVTVAIRIRLGVAAGFARHRRRRHPGHQRRTPPATFGFFQFGRRQFGWAGALFSLAPAQVDPGVLFDLAGFQVALAHDLKDRHQGRHPTLQRGFTFEQLGEGEIADLLGAGEDAGDARFDRNIITTYRARAKAAEPSHDGEPMLSQAAGIKFAEVDRFGFFRIFGNLLFETAVDTLSAGGFASDQQLGGLLVFAVGEEFADQVGARVGEVVVVGAAIMVGFFFGRWRGEGAGLDLDQGCGHQDEVAGDL